MGILARIMVFLFIEEVFDIKKIIFFFFGNNIDTYYRKVLTLTLFLFTIMPENFLVVLIFFVGLVDRRLFFSTRYVNRGGVNRFIFLGVFILLFCWFVASETPGIDL